MFVAGFVTGTVAGLCLALYLGNPEAFRRAFFDGYDRVPAGGSHVR